MLDSSCSLFPLAYFAPISLFLFVGLGDSHCLMQIPSSIGVMSSAYGINFTLLRMCMKLMGLIESSAPLYVMSLFLPKNTLISCPLLHGSVNLS